jgi:hypothetical protein
MQYDKIERLTDSLKKYVSINYELISLQATERSATVISRLVRNMIIGQIAILFLLFFSICVSFFISEYIGNNYAGFGIVSAFYLVTGIVLILTRKNAIEIPIRNSIIKKTLNNN